MRESWTGASRVTRIAMIVLTWLTWTASPETASAQSVGPGDSPGRAAYRPESQWDNGPFYTAPHVNPSLPHRGVDNFLLEADPSTFPYTSAPRGHFDAFSPGRGPVYPYAE